MSAAPRTLADTGIAGVIVDRETFTSQDVFNAGFDGRQAGVAYGIVLASLEQARHAQSAANNAVRRIVERAATVGDPPIDAIRERDLPELAAQFRALADELDAAAKVAAPALRDAA